MDSRAERQSLIIPACKWHNQKWLECIIIYPGLPWMAFVVWPTYELLFLIAPQD